MAERGSLFAWHLKLEGKPIVPEGESMDTVLPVVAPYRKAKNDIESYWHLLEDIRYYSGRTNQSVIYDMAMLFTIARNTAMVLCFVGGAPTFGRTAVFETAERLYGDRFPFNFGFYRNLLNWKLWYARGVARPQFGSCENDSAELLAHVENFVKFAKIVAGESMS